MGSQATTTPTDDPRALVGQVLLETYREVLQDHFDVPALVDILGDVQKRTTRVVDVDVAAVNQNGDIVYSVDGKIFIERRGTP